MIKKPESKYAQWTINIEELCECGYTDQKLNDHVELIMGTKRLGNFKYVIPVLYMDGNTISDSSEVFTYCPNCGVIDYFQKVK